MWHPIFRQWVTVAFVALLLLGVRVLWPLMTPLSLSLLLTYIFVPVVDRVESDTGWSRTGAAAFVYLLLIIGIILTPLLVAPVIVEQVQTLMPALLRATDELGTMVERLGTPVILGQQIDPYDFYLQFSNQLVSLGTTVASSSVNVLFGFATSFFSTVLWLFFMLVISFYIVRDSPNISRYFWGLIPREARGEVFYLTRRIDRTWNAFLRGQLLLSTVIFVVTTLALMILGVPQALALGFLAGILNLIPSLGPILSSIPAIAVALIQGSNHFDMSNLLFALIVIGAYTLIQQLESNFLVPRIIGGSVQLHPAVVLIGALVGLRLVGLLGIFLAAPTLASLRIISGYAYHKLLDPAYQPPGVLLPASIEGIMGPHERPMPPIPPPTSAGGSPRWRQWLTERLTPPPEERPDA